MGLLYHYTSQLGLLGVLNSRSIWATHAHFLNDPTEFVHALTFASSVAGQYYEDDYYEAFGRWVYQRLASVKGDSVYVASFSEKPDLLSQWRGYCPSGNGYCIGFDQDALQAYCDERGYRLERCLYGHDEQKAEVAQIIAAALAFFPPMPCTRQEFEQLGNREKINCMMDFNFFMEREGEKQAITGYLHIRDSLLSVAPRFKHEGFHEEAEWRIIVDRPADSEVQFRPGASYVIPHLSLDLLQASPDALKALIVGPNPNLDRAQKACQILMASHGYAPNDVVTSQIPFNNW